MISLLSYGKTFWKQTHKQTIKTMDLSVFRSTGQLCDITKIKSRISDGIVMSWKHHINAFFWVAMDHQVSNHPKELYNIYSPTVKHICFLWKVLFIKDKFFNFMRGGADTQNFPIQHIVSYLGWKLSMNSSLISHNQLRVLSQLHEGLNHAIPVAIWSEWIQAEYIL